jgi:hypothetical protein
MGSGNYGGQNNCQSIAGLGDSSTSTLNSISFGVFGASANIWGKFRLYGIVKS